MYKIDSNTLDIKNHLKTKTINEIKSRLRWLDAYLYDKELTSIDSSTIQKIKEAKLSEGVSTTTVNRMLQTLRAVLRFAQENGLVLSIPKIRLHKEENKRIRWLSKEKAGRLLKELQDDLRDMAEFTLHTGLRESNVRLLTWQQVDLNKKIAWICPEDTNNSQPLGVSLNKHAVLVLRRRHGINEKYCFTPKGIDKARYQCTNSAWKSALKRVGIENFR